MNSQKVGSAPHFSENLNATQKSRKSIHGSNRYAHAEETKDAQQTLEDANDSDYERVELFSERRELTGRSSKKLTST